MSVNRPRRLDGVSYVGYQRYFVTICTAFRRRIFISETSIEGPLSQLRQAERVFEFATVAYCFMPDHVHLLSLAQSERADLPEFVRRFKQLTGYAYKKAHGEPLWQPGYHERILRDEEATVAVARYVLENPVRAGLAGQLMEYPLAGSDLYDRSALLTAWEQA